MSNKDIWDSGLKIWMCYNCGIGVQEKTLNKKPSKCPRCGNPDLKFKKDKN